MLVRKLAPFGPTRFCVPFSQSNRTSAASQTGLDWANELQRRVWCRKYGANGWGSRVAQCTNSLGKLLARLWSMCFVPYGVVGNMHTYVAYANARFDRSFFFTLHGLFTWVHAIALLVNGSN